MILLLGRLARTAALAAALVLPLACVAAQSADDPAKAQAERQETQPLNNAPLWREVRSGAPAHTEVQGRETSVLIQSTMKLPGLPAVTAGEAWRLARVPLSTIGGALIALALAALAVFYRWRGAIRVHGKPSGRFIQRFSDTERVVHWTVAISFSILAVTGLIIMLGKYLLLPILGHVLFGWLASLSKNLHNFVGPIFAVSLPILIGIFVRDNLPKTYDWQWIVRFGGMLSKAGRDVPSGRFNAGEKGLFWVLPCVLSVVLVVTGFILDFPNFDQTRIAMQQANLLHMIAAVLGIAVACFHVYLGTIGQRGAYQAMRTGYVDETWAKEHHAYWYEDVKAGRSRQRFAEDAPAEARSRVLRALEPR
jgi:formate dehydrogenase subunit gamma